MILSQRAQEFITYYKVCGGVVSDNPDIADWLVWFYPVNTLQIEVQRIVKSLPKPLAYFQKVISRRIPPILHRDDPPHFLAAFDTYQVIAEHVQIVTQSELEAINAICRDYEVGDVHVGLTECRQRGVFSAHYLLRILQSTVRQREEQYTAIAHIKQRTVITMLGLEQTSGDSLISALLERMVDSGS